MKSGQNASAAGGTFTGWHMLGVMIAFFGVIIGVNGFMAYSSARTWTGLVVQNSYVASQEFNTKLAIAREREERGWEGGLDLNDGVLRFTLLDGIGRPVPLVDVTIALSRPIGVDGDQTVILTAQDDGSHEIAVALDPGAWNAAILARVPGEPDYEHRARLVAGTRP